jgi:predicted acylesterase/phospholipase RssA
MDSMPSVDREFDRFAVLTIQGGGIYGLSLLGQLSTVVYDLKVVPVALAGASAGAIVATLFWAGWTPKEIRNLFADLADKGQLVGLVGPFDSGFDFASFRALKDRFDGYLSQLEHLAQPSRPSKFRKYIKAPFVAIRGLWTARKFKADVTPHVANRGIFRGEDLERKIDELVRSGSAFQQYQNELPQDRPLRFSDVRALMDRHPNFVLPSLFLTATNTTTRQLVLFSSVDDQHLNVPIARAVRASAGFPVFFRPVEVPGAPDGGWYVDGGVISNYPAWVFTHEFRRHLAFSPAFRGVAPRPWVHIGLRLGGDDPGKISEGEAAPQAFIQSIIALLTGQARSQLEDRLSSFIARSLLVSQPMRDTGGPENLLDVDRLTGDDVREMFDRGARCSGIQLSGVSFSLPNPAQIEPSLERLVSKALRLFGEPNNNRIKFRSNIFIPQQQELHICYSYNMSGDPDENLVLPFTGGLTGFCFTRRRPLICNLSRISELARRGTLNPDELFGMPMELHDRVKQDRTWLASVPIFDPYASYPRDLSPRQTQPTWKPEGYHYYGPPAALDGAVLGVLNLDADLPYEELGLDQDPAIHWTDVRVEGIINLLTAVASEAGHILSSAFAFRGEHT